MFRRFLPAQVSFFDFFEQHAELAIQACNEFLTLTKTRGDDAAVAARIKEIENQADIVTHKCVAEVSKTFITPIDRVDIPVLIKRLDDIIDAVDACASRLALYELTEIREEARLLAEVLVKSSTAILAALRGMRDLGNAKNVQEHLIQVHHLENEADAILRAALVRLFKEEEMHPILVIKWKEVFERLEKATDRSEEVANIIERILIEAS